MMIEIETVDFEKMGGLIACVVQDIETRTVLMVGFQNKDALAKSLAINKVTFFSRTKNRLWTKGEESGNFLEIKEAHIDCDKDAVLFLVKAPKETCHLKTFSCFDKH